jgi:hypothetical protein
MIILAAPPVLPKIKKAAMVRGLVGKVYFASVRQNRSRRSSPFSMFAMLVA